MAAAAIPAFAGEFDCAQSKCSIENLQSSQWKPSSCHDPIKPKAARVTTAAEFDTAADQFNKWTADVKVYLACVAGEAKQDAENSQQIIVKAAKELQEAQVAAVQAEREKLEASRPKNSQASTPTPKSGY